MKSTMSDLQPTFYTLDELKPQLIENTEVLAYWKRLRKGAKIPLWPAFDPLDIFEQVPGCMVLQVVNGHLKRVQLFGTRLVERFGIDLTDRNFLDAFEPEERKKILLSTRILTTRPAIACTIMVGRTAGDTLMHSEVLVLPFTDETQGINHVVMSINQFEFKAAQPGVVQKIRQGNLSEHRFYDL